MEALASIPFEIQATVAAILIVALISILQILDLRRAKNEYALKNQEISRALERGESIADMKQGRVISLFSLTIQFIFGFIVLALLALWTVFLFRVGFVGSAIASGIFALVGIYMPFYIWRRAKRINQERQQLISAFESRPKPREIPKESFQAEPIKKAPEPIKEVQKTSTVTQKEPIVEKKPEPLAKAVAPEPAASTAVPEVRKKPASVSGVPEDSMLRRHYMTHMASMTAKAAFTAKAAEIRSKPPEEVPETKPEQPVLPEVSSKKEKVPQDSMLRRHYVAALRSHLESEFPPQPTDSILKRHYDGWKDAAIERQVAKCLKGCDT